MPASNQSQTDAATRRYLRHAMAAPLLSQEREVELATRWRESNDEAARHELVAAHIRLVASVAARYRRLGLPMADLIQEGAIGLLQAAKRFDPERNVRFATYAGWWVRAQMQDYLLRSWSVVRIGSSSQQKRLFARLRRSRGESEGRSGLDETQRLRIAGELGIDRRDVELMEAVALRQERSFNAPVEEDGAVELQDLLADDGPGPEEIVFERMEAERRAATLSKALKELQPRERHVIEQRYLIEETRTLKSLGAELGVSKERVRQIETAALQKLRAAVKDETQEENAGG